MITVIYASETGNAESLAEDTGEHLQKLGGPVRVVDIEDFEMGEIKDSQLLFAIVSTWGEGDPPTTAEDFFEEFKDADPLGLESVSFAVLALGDTNYEDFCQFGKDLDAELERHGAQRVLPRVDCDVDFEDPFAEWLKDVAKVVQDRLGEPVAG